MESNNLELENKRRHINELEQSLYKIIKSFCKDNEFLTEYVMNIHDEIIESEVSFIFEMQDTNNKCAQEKYVEDINAIKFDNSFEDEKGFVYILKDGDLFKIGKTKNLENRISSHRCSNVRFDVFFISDKVNKYSKLESKLHYIFRNKCFRGEWFKLDDKNIVTAIDVINKWGHKS